MYMLWVRNASSDHVSHRRVTETDPKCIQNFLLCGPGKSVIARTCVNSPTLLYMKYVYRHQDTL